MTDALDRGRSAVAGQAWARAHQELLARGETERAAARAYEHRLV